MTSPTSEHPLHAPMAGYAVPTMQEPGSRREVENRKWPREVRILTADNGHLILVGCRKFVHEGGADTLTGDLQKYLDLDTEISKKYGYQGQCAFINDGAMLPEAAEECEPWLSRKYLSPVFNYARAELKPEVSTYRVSNGTITLDYKQGTAMVLPTNERDDGSNTDRER